MAHRPIPASVIFESASDRSRSDPSLRARWKPFFLASFSNALHVPDWYEGPGRRATPRELLSTPGPEYRGIDQSDRPSIPAWQLLRDRRTLPCRRFANQSAEGVFSDPNRGWSRWRPRWLGLGYGRAGADLHS